MGAHTDLIAAADKLAAEARQVAEDTGGHAARPQRVGEFAAAAKTALEAASLTQTVGPGELAEALGAIQDELEAAGVLVESIELEPAAFLRLTFESVQHWRREATAAQGLAHAFERLRDLAAGLERDFTAADTETSRRIAARIHTALEDAGQLLQATEAPS